MSRLDSSIPQILGTDGDGRRKAMLYYISQQPKAVRDAYMIPDDTDTNLSNASRVAALQALGQGWPDRDGSYQIDPDMMLGANPLVEMTQRRDVQGRKWVPAVGMPQIGASATGIAQPDPDNIPKGAIIVTTDFEEPADDLEVTMPLEFKFPVVHPEGDHDGVGAAYNLGDSFPEFSVRFDGDKEYRKFSVILENSRGLGQLLWVRVK